MFPLVARPVAAVPTGRPGAALPRPGATSGSSTSAGRSAGGPPIGPAAATTRLGRGLAAAPCGALSVVGCSCQSGGGGRGLLLCAACLAGGRQHGGLNVASRVASSLGSGSGGQGGLRLARELRLALSLTVSS